MTHDFAPGFMIGAQRTGQVPSMPGSVYVTNTHILERSYFYHVKKSYLKKDIFT